jgi:hypothetical protein
MKRARLVLLSLVAVLLFAAGLATACHYYFLRVAITAPAEGQQITGDRTIAVTGTATGMSWWHTYVAVSVNGGPPQYRPVYRGSFRAQVTLADGDNVITATLRTGPLAARASVHVSYGTVTEEPFQIVVTAPAAGATLTGSRSQSVRGTVSGRASAAVAIAVNGLPPVAAPVTDGGFDVVVELADGENVIVATATAGPETVSSTVRVTYAPVPAPSIAIDWPFDGETVLGGRVVTLRGRVANVNTPSVLVAVNDGAPVAATVVEGRFSADVRLDDRGNTLFASLSAPEGSASASVNVNYPFLTLDTFQVAERVLGRPGATSRAPYPCDDPTLPISASDFCYPFGSAAWDGATLFLSDFARNRVLAFAGIPGEDGAAAAFALGQSELTTNAPSSTARGLAGPETVRIAGGKLFVADTGNQRILVFDSGPAGFGPSASAAIGASSPDLAGTGACTADALLRAESFVVVDTKLIVADSGHNRVLVWNEIPTLSGTPADLVLGQESFTSCEANAGGVSSRSLFVPTDVWSDGVRLYVADYGNNRILGWSSFPQASNTPADLVLGQGSFDTADPGTSPGGLQLPYFLASNGNQLFVADQWNNRVLVWNRLPTSVGALPDVVLGQAAFDRGAQNDDDQDGTTELVPSGRTLFWPAGVTATEDALLVTDMGNSRTLVFRGR